MLLGLYEALACDVRFGSKADILGGLRDVRFAPKKQTLTGNSWMSALCQKQTFAGCNVDQTGGVAVPIQIDGPCCAL
jgi:hypothetical protein